MSGGKFIVSDFLDDYVAQPTIREQIQQRCVDLLRQGVSVQLVNGMTGEVTTIRPFEQYFIYDGQGRRVVGGDD